MEEVTGRDIKLSIVIGSSNPAVDRIRDLLKMSAEPSDGESHSFTYAVVDSKPEPITRRSKHR